MLVRPPKTHLKLTVRADCGFCMYVSPPRLNLSVTALTPCLSGRGSRPMDRCLPPSLPQLLASEIKQTFLSTNLGCLLAFEQQAGRAHTHTILSITS